MFESAAKLRWTHKWVGRCGNSESAVRVNAVLTGFPRNGIM